MTHRQAIRLTLLAALGLMAASCASARSKAEAEIPNSLERFPLAAAERQDESLLAIHDTGLSPTQSGALAALAQRWRSEPGATIKLRLPRGGPQEVSGAAMAEQARTVLLSGGVHPVSIIFEGYSAPNDPDAPLVATFVSLQAVIPECGKQWDNLTATRNNTNHSNFGCAVAANMASQIANPADIVAPRRMDPADASRRMVTFDKYRKGEPTGATSDGQGSGAVSQVKP